MIIESIINNDTTVFDDATNEIIQNIFLNVAMNWMDIIENKELMDGLDMEKNTLCKYFKNENPFWSDSYVRASVITIMIIITMITINPQSIIIKDID